LKAWGKLNETFAAIEELYLFMKFDETAESSSVLDGKIREPASLAAEVDAERGSHIASCIGECCKKSALASRGS